MQNIVVLGAGYGGVRAIQRLARLMGKDQQHQLVLVNKHNYHMFMTQLHEHAVGTSEMEEIMVPLDDILADKRVNFIKGWVDSIDLSNQIVLINHGDIKLSFKYLVVALGSEPEYYNIPGLKENSMSLRSLYSANAIRQKVDKMLQEGKKQHLTFVVGGGGLTGVEFAGELAYQLRQVQEKHQIIMVEGAKELLPGMASDMAHYAMETLEDLGVEVVTGDLIKSVTPDVIKLSSGRKIQYSLLLWAGGIKGNKVLANTALKTTGNGRVEVNQYLQAINTSNVYVIGDSALAKDSKTGKLVIPTAQAAIQQGSVAAYNIYADIKGKSKQVYNPVVLGTLISIGRGCGLGKIKSFKLKGTTASLLKELVPLKYRYSLGGLKMLGASSNERNRYICGVKESKQELYQ